MFCEPCLEKRGVEVPATQERYECGPLCENCRQSESEAAHERMLSEYYGSSSPQSLTERYQADAQVKREQRSMIAHDNLMDRVG